MYEPITVQIDRGSGEGTYRSYTSRLIIIPTDRLTNNPASDYQPAWSPDGNKIAFTSNREGGYDIYTMNANGQGMDNLTNSVTRDFNPDWQPFRETPVFPVRQLHHTATATSSATATATASAAGAAQYQYASALPGTGGVVSPATLLAIVPAILLLGGGLLSAARLLRCS